MHEKCGRIQSFIYSTRNSIRLNICYGNFYIIISIALMMMMRLKQDEQHIWNKIIVKHEKHQVIKGGCLSPRQENKIKAQKRERQCQGGNNMMGKCFDWKLINLLTKNFDNKLVKILNSKLFPSSLFSLGKSWSKEAILIRALISVPLQNKILKSCWIFNYFLWNISKKYIIK